MVSRKLLNNVLRNITAGKEENPQSVPAPPSEAPEQAAPDQPGQNINKPVQRWRYYFYDAPPENSIKFSYISDILEKDSPERDSLVAKLEGGNTGKYFADYFLWRKVLVATTQYSQDGKSLVVYSADLTPMGTKISGSERIYPDSSNVTVDVFEADLMMFSDKRGNSKVINIDNSGESLFSDQEPPSNIVNVLLNRTKPAGKFINHNDFLKIFDEYRIWATNLNQLLLPNFDIPTNDDVQGGHYMGGQTAFNQLVGPVLQKIEQKKQEEPQEPSLGEKVEKQPANKSPFEPVDEQSKERVHGDNLDKPTGSPMEKNKRFSSDQYKINRMARRVLASYIEEEASEDKEGISTGTTVKGIGDPKSEADKYKAQATKNRSLAKKYDEIAQMMTQFQDQGNI